MTEVQFLMTVAAEVIAGVIVYLICKWLSEK